MNQVNEQRELFVGELVRWITQYGIAKAERMFNGFLSQQTDCEGEVTRAEMEAAWTEARQRVMPM